jgi:hypothetical protein
MPTVILTSGTTWIVPHGVATLDSVECWGGGAPGNDGNDIGSGGGGAYSKTNNLAVMPNQTCYLQIPGATAISAGNPADCWFSKTSNSPPAAPSDGCLAKSGAKSTGTVAGQGGQASGCVGDVKYSGGTGGYSSGFGRGGAGGGAAASPFGAGGAGATPTSGSTGGNGGNSPSAGSGGTAGSAGGSVADGGGGGGGGNGSMFVSPTRGADGGAPGGGGQSGANMIGNHVASGGAGAPGQIRITYRYATRAIVV